MDYPVLQVDGVTESTDFSKSGLPSGVRSVTFASSVIPYTKKGIFKLVQMVVLVLLRSPGRDLMSPDVGGGLRKLASRPMGESLEMTRRAEISLAVSTAASQIRDGQTGVSLPPEERLRELSVVKAEYLYDQQEWSIALRIISDAGGAADVLL